MSARGILVALPSWAHVLGWAAVAIAGPWGCDRSESLQRLEQDVVVEIPRLKTFGVELSQFCASPGARFSDAFFQNESMVVRDQKFLADWDRDGLSNVDDVRMEFGFAFKTADSNGDGYSDLAVWIRGLTLNEQAGLKACPDFSQDSDRDGLGDCEENALLRTDPQAFDSDSDGIADGLEVRFGMNPLDAADVYQDNDGDELPNIDEVRVGTPIDETNTAALNRYLQKVETGREKASAGQETGECRWLRATNIPLMPVSNGNLVRVYALEILASGVKKLRRTSVVVPQTTADKTIVKLKFKEDVK